MQQGLTQLTVNPFLVLDSAMFINTISFQIATSAPAPCERPFVTSYHLQRKAMGESVWSDVAVKLRCSIAKRSFSVPLTFYLMAMRKCLLPCPTELQR